MGDPEHRSRPATHADIEAVPRNIIIEIIGGEFLTRLPRAPYHVESASGLGVLLGGPFRYGIGGPGGWRILDEPEIHLGQDVILPDLAGWRTERMPSCPTTGYYGIAPDWICEVLSPPTEAHDRAEKMRVYARERVRYAWLVDPLLQTLEVFVLNAEREWVLRGVYRDNARVRAEPFDAIELDLGLLWAM
jgi:hypothetical protein